MTTMTSPPEVRTEAEQAADAPSGITRRREVPETGRVRRAATRRRAVRTGRTATGQATARVVSGATDRVATTRTVRPAERRTAAPVPGRAAGRRTTTAPRAPFAVLVVGMLGGALVGLVLLNTVLAQQAFTLNRVQQENQRLDERKQALQEDIARENSPQVLYAKARRLGMRDADRPVFVDPGHGR